MKTAVECQKRSSKLKKLSNSSINAKYLPEQPRQTETRSIWSVESHPRIFLGVIGTKSSCTKTQHEKIQSIFIENLLISFFSFEKSQLILLFFTCLAKTSLLAHDFGDSAPKKMTHDLGGVVRFYTRFREEKIKLSTIEKR